MESPHREILERLARAARMAEVLQECGGDPEAAEKMSEFDWQLAAAAAAALNGGEQFIPCKDTRELTIGALRIAAGGVR